MKRVAIIGGGISGMSAAFYLEKARQNGAELDYMLFEATSRLGGVLKTEVIRDCIVEAGPDSYLSTKPWATELAREVGLQDELIGSNDFQRKTYILQNSRLVPMPDGIQMIVPTKAWPIATSPLLSFATKLRMLREYIAPPNPLASGEDESVASFVARHFGEEVVQKLANPLLAGVYGGDAAQLSARAVLPNYVALESQHCSLVRGVLRSRKESAVKGSIFTSFKGGMQQFVDAISAQLRPESIALNCPVTSIQSEARGWRVTAANAQGEPFTHLIIALPSHSASKLLHSVDAALARQLEEIRYLDSTTVALGYSAKTLSSALPPGFGFLVPRSEGRSIIACTFVHNKFSHRVPDDFALLRVFLTDAIANSDLEIQATVENELKQVLGIEAKPIFTSISRWPAAMPQYNVGHLDKIAEIERLANQVPRLQLIGNAYRGIGIPDCVREGKQAAANILSI
jgi:oxygen-dependent protoporphyrinogen oxidase